MKPPRVKESRVNMECKLHQLIPVSDKFLGGTLELGGSSSLFTCRIR
ncbi:MAG: hypothetical protein WDO18_15580 [Acidobacteriota bacterium]